MIRRTKNRTHLKLEPLDIRATPATMVNSTTLTYQDADGDSVKVVFGKALLTAGDANSIFKFDTGNVNGSNSTKQQLLEIDLAPITIAPGTTVTVTAAASPTNGGDGMAAIGEINATGINIGAVNIQGDLGKIAAGNNGGSTPAIAGLTVQSMGRYGLTTGAPNLVSDIEGNLSSLTVKSDLKNAEMVVNGSIGNISIGGSLIGGAANVSGEIEAAASIGNVSIKGSIIGGSGLFSGCISADHNSPIGSITIGGSVRGGSGMSSGAIFAGKFSTATINGDLDGGDGDESGILAVQNGFSGVTVGGSLRGGSGTDSGMIHSAAGAGTVMIKGAVVGGSGDDWGVVQSVNGSLGNLKFGSVHGGAGNQSGFISSGLDMGSVTINGDFVGGAGGNSGEIDSGAKLARLTVTGSVEGGAGDNSGLVESGSDISSVTVGGSMIGGDGQDTGGISSGGKLASVTVNGSMNGGVGANGGRIFANSDIGQIKVGLDMVAGSNGGGGVYSFGKIAGLSVSGSMDGAGVYCLGGYGNVSVGGDVTGTIDTAGGITNISIGGSLWGGQIDASGAIGTLTINGDIVGDSASGTQSAIQTGYVDASRIGNLNVGRSLIAGVDNTSGPFFNNGAIRVANDIGNITVKGDIVGDATNPFLITARGSQNPTSTTDVAIGNVTIQGNVEFADIIAGADELGMNQNADAQIGNVTVAGDWMASSIAAGVTPGVSPYYGTSLDKKMSGANVKDVATVLSKIASIAIGGHALGTPGGLDSFGFVAEQVGSMKIDNVPISLQVGAHNDVVPIGITSDFDVREL
jgi:hypothetical protein